MPIRVATADDAEAIARCSARLAAGGWRQGLPRPGSGPQRQTVYVAVDRDGEIRAGVRVVHETFSVLGQRRMGSWLQAPISEGVVDPRHSLAALQLGRHVSKMHPLVLGLGIGSLDQAAARFLIAAGSAHAAVPFVFLPLRPRRVAEELRLLRRSPRTALAARVAAATGLPRAAVGARRAWSRWRGPHGSVERIARFGDWATAIDGATDRVIAARARRDEACLNARYPATDGRFVRLRVRRPSGDDVGWAVVAPLQLRDHGHFGDLRLGVVVDASAHPGLETVVMASAVEALADHGVELVVANWSSTAWRAAARACGMLGGPTNYLVFAPPTATPLLTEVPIGDMHLTRGDSDGMVHFKGTPLG